MDQRSMALVMTVCSLMGRECNPEDVELRYQQAMRKIAAYRDREALLQSRIQGGLGFQSNDED
jgi:hypothetical protein